MIPNDLPPWHTVYQQTQRWLRAGVFEAMVHDLRTLLRVAEGRNEQPSAAIFDSRTLQSSPESGERAGYDGAKRRKGSKTHMAVDTLGHLLALHVTAADEQDRAQVEQLAQAVKRAPAKRWKWPLSTKATQERMLPSKRPPRAFVWKWSSCPTPSAALCSCLALGG